MAHRWVLVADSPFLPADGGGEREHLGFVHAAFAAGRLAAVVVPSGVPVDLAPYRDVLGEVPVIVTPRRLSPILLAHPRYPFVVASRPMPTWLPRRISDLASDATGVVAFSYKVRLIGQGLSSALGLPLVVRQHNREGDYHRSLVSGLRGPRRLVMRWEAARITRDERRFDRSDTVTAIADISADDANRRRAAGARRVVHVPPFAYDASFATAQSDDRGLQDGGHPKLEGDGKPHVVFLGALDVPTNLTALRWLVDNVWPTIHSRSPELVLDVVGRHPTDAVRALVASATGAVLHADVAEVGSYLRRARVAVNPAVSGSGVNIKVIDYLQAGVPLVSTSLATRGLPLRAGVDLEVHDDPLGFADAVVALATDERRAASLAEAGSARIELLLNPARNLDRFAIAFDSTAPLPEDF